MKHDRWIAGVIVGLVALAPGLANAQGHHGGGHGAPPAPHAAPPAPRGAPGGYGYHGGGARPPPGPAPGAGHGSWGGGPPGHVPPPHHPPNAGPGRVPAAPFLPPGFGTGHAYPPGHYYGGGPPHHGYGTYPYGRNYRYGRVPPGRFGAPYYRQHFYGLPGWRAYGSYGLPPVLFGFPSLGFLADGLLVGSYDAAGAVIYVYIIEVNGVPMEYRVNGAGEVISVTPAY